MARTRSSTSPDEDRPKLTRAERAFIKTKSAEDALVLTRYEYKTLDSWMEMPPDEYDFNITVCKRALAETAYRTNRVNYIKSWAANYIALDITMEAMDPVFWPFGPVLVPDTIASTVLKQLILDRAHNYVRTRSTGNIMQRYHLGEFRGPMGLGATEEERGPETKCETSLWLASKSMTSMGDMGFSADSLSAVLLQRLLAIKIRESLDENKRALDDGLNEAQRERISGLVGRDLYASMGDMAALQGAVEEDD